MKLYYRILRILCIFKYFETHFIMQLFFDFGHALFMNTCLFVCLFVFKCMQLWLLMVQKSVQNLSHTRNKLRVTFYPLCFIYIINVIMEKISEKMAVFTKKYKNVSFKFNSLIEYRVITYAVNLCGKCVPYLQIVKQTIYRIYFFVW